MALSIRSVSASLPSAESSASRFEYDVFLSFRGVDTREGIISHLYHELQTVAGIKTFKDDQGLEVGMYIGPNILRAIKESRYALVVLSPNYASSRWCLDELANIFRCMEGKDRILPLFYHVDPSDVRNQIGSFQLTKHEEKFTTQDPETVKEWKAALGRVANLSGWDRKNFHSERELVKHIVEVVSNKLHQVPRPIKIESATSIGPYESNNRGKNFDEGIYSAVRQLELQYDKHEFEYDLDGSGLCNMAEVCTSMRERCTSDHFWDKHMKQKWGKLVGAAAYKEWEVQHVVATTSRRNSLSNQTKKKGGVFDSLSGILPFPSWVIRPKLQSSRVKKTTTTLPVDSIMSLYLSLESGNFWFPAQVYNRENGVVGFMLSCYDAQLSCDSGTDTFQARYSFPYEQRTIEEHIPWDRLRAAPVDTPPHRLHVSDCLHDLKPGDHIEIQWRRSKECTYGWWYGVIGHFEMCDGNENHCHCHYNDIVVLEFSQYSPGSRWRQMMISRKDHREEGNEADGFYGGIRKLYDVEEIAKWKLLWPNHVLE